jgi:enamine deaminase RidA (YjgF/YER057c/UK114 family)
MSAAVVFGGIVAVAGQVSIDAAGGLVGEGNFDRQARQCVRNLEVILEKSGSSLRGVVQLTAYLSRAEYAPKYLALRAEVFPDDPPATTTIIARLLDDRFLLELQALAIVTP